MFTQTRKLCALRRIQILDSENDNYDASSLAVNTEYQENSDESETSGEDKAPLRHELNVAAYAVINVSTGWGIYKKYLTQLLNRSFKILEISFVKLSEKNEMILYPENTMQQLYQS